MKDYTLCDNIDCKFKETCFRFKSKDIGHAWIQRYECKSKKESFYIKN